MVMGGLWIWKMLTGATPPATPSIPPAADASTPPEGQWPVAPPIKAGTLVPLPPTLIAPHGPLIPGVDFDVPITPPTGSGMWSAGLPLDATYLKRLASYADGTIQDLWGSPTQGRFIVTTTAQGIISVAPDAPISFNAFSM